MPDFGERELKNLQNPSLFGARVSKLAWNWEFIEGWQELILLSKDRYGIANVSRQCGKSSTFMIKAVHKIISKPNALVLVVAEQRQSNEDLRKARDLCRAYDSYLQEHTEGKLTLNLLTDNKTSLELNNNSRLIALPANEKIRGYSNPDMVIIDEASRIPDEVFIAIDPMITMGMGQLFITSTPNGNQGFFYHQWKDPRYTLRLEIPYFKSERVMKEKKVLDHINALRFTLGDAYVKQEYECAFLDDISSLFTEQALNASLDEKEAPFSDTMKIINTALGKEDEFL